MKGRRLLVGLVLAGVALLAVLGVRVVLRRPLAAVSVALSEFLWGPVERPDAPASPEPATPEAPARRRRPDTPADRKVRTQLDETVVGFTFNEQPVLDALDFLQTLGNVNIVFDRGKLSDPNQTVTLKVVNVPLEAGLRALCEQLGLAHVVVDGIVFISDRKGVYDALYPPPPPPPMVTRDELSREDRRVYDKLEETVVSFTFNEQPLAEAVDFLQTLGEVNIVLDPRAVEKDTSVTLKLTNVPLATALKLMVEQLGLRYTLREKVVFVSDGAGVARRIARAAWTGLDRRPAAADRKVYRQLRETIVSFTFNEQPVMEAFDFLQTLASVNIVFDRNKLTDPKQTVTLKLSNVPAETAVKLLVEQLGLTYVIRDGVVFVSDEQGINRPGQ